MPKMRLSKNGAMELIGHEAIVQTRYLDSVDVWTIGVGHTKSAGPPDPAGFLETMDLKAVFDLFMHDVAKYVASVNAVLKKEVTQTEFDALVSFHFNTGRIASASLTKSINAGDKVKAAEEFMNWRKPPEIIPRRTKEQKLFAQGVYSNGGRATVYPADENGKVQWSKGKIIDLAAALSTELVPG
jgi:lysozyme